MRERLEIEVKNGAYKLILSLEKSSLTHHLSVQFFGIFDWRYFGILGYYPALSFLFFPPLAGFPLFPSLATIQPLVFHFFPPLAVIPPWACIRQVRVLKVPISGPDCGFFSILNGPGPLGTSGGHSHTSSSTGEFGVHSAPMWNTNRNHLAHLTKNTITAAFYQ